jgi:hypothetical protein
MMVTRYEKLKVDFLQVLWSGDTSCSVDDDSSSNAVTIVIIVVVCGGALILLGILFFIIFKRYLIV